MVNKYTRERERERERARESMREQRRQVVDKPGRREPVGVDKPTEQESRAEQTTGRQQEK